MATIHRKIWAYDAAVRCSDLSGLWSSITHFTLHLSSDSRVSDSSPLAYLRERTGKLDTGAFLHCKDAKICFVGLASGIVKTGE